MGMQNDQISRRRASGRTSQARFSAAEARGPVIDQEGHEIPHEPLRDFGGFRFDFQTANPFGNLTREQRMARLEAAAKLLDVAFILPGTNIRYGIDGLIGLIPVVGDLIASALSLWLVREARLLGAPWHVTARSAPSRWRAMPSTCSTAPTCATPGFCGVGWIRSRGWIKTGKWPSP
jgi:Domain of unknown function (DUF4112)